MTESEHLQRCAIALALNDRFALPALTLLESIRRHGGPLAGVTLVVLTQGLSSPVLDALEKAATRADLRFSLRILPDVEALGPVPRWAVATCLRLYCGDQCADFERVLYLDSDMLVLHSLESLFLADLNEHAAAAVINHPPLDLIRIAIPRTRREECVKGDAPYFNAGILLIDTAKWMLHQIGVRSREYIARFPSSRLLDQDALNVALFGDWQPLEYEWNAPAGPLEQAPMLTGLARLRPSLAESISRWTQAQRCPHILHFIGQPKPWETDYPWRDLAELYRAYCPSLPLLSWPRSEINFLERNGEQRRRDFQRL